MATGFSTSELLPSLSRYPVSKLGGGINSSAAALSSQANALHTTLENNLGATVAKHQQIADGHRAIAAQLPDGKAKDAHLAAAQAHEDVASEIKAIRPVEGNSIASNALTADKAQQYSSRAANFTNAANQATINQPVAKSVTPVSDVSPEAQQLLDAYNIPVTRKYPNLKAIAGMHWHLAHEHLGIADGLDLKASQERANNNGTTTPLARELTAAANVNRQAAQAHFTAGNSADQNAYSTSKVEGGWKPMADIAWGHNKKASENALAMSQQADNARNEVMALTKAATAAPAAPPVAGGKPAPTPPIPGRYTVPADRYTSADPTARHMDAMADAHGQAANMWQQASTAYHSGDLGTASNLYSQATEASARAHDLADQAPTI